MSSRIIVVKSVARKRRALYTVKRTQSTTAANVCAMRLTIKDDWSRKYGVAIKKGVPKPVRPFFMILRANYHPRVR